MTTIARQLAELFVRFESALTKEAAFNALNSILALELASGGRVAWAFPEPTAAPSALR